MPLEDFQQRVKIDLRNTHVKKTSVVLFGKTIYYHCGQKGCTSPPSKLGGRNCPSRRKMRLIALCQEHYAETKGCICQTPEKHIKPGGKRKKETEIVVYLPDVQGKVSESSTQPMVGDVPTTTSPSTKPTKKKKTPKVTKPTSERNNPAVETSPNTNLADQVTTLQKNQQKICKNFLPTLEANLEEKMDEEVEKIQRELRETARQLDVEAKSNQKAVDAEINRINNVMSDNARMWEGQIKKIEDTYGAKNEKLENEYNIRKSEFDKMMASMGKILKQIEESKDEDRYADQENIDNKTGDRKRKRPSVDETAYDDDDREAANNEGIENGKRKKSKSSDSDSSTSSSDDDGNDNPGSISVSPGSSPLLFSSSDDNQD